jgi:MoaA/NifB/PqqE/SkfB family radical SAM enzyme
MIVDMKQFLRLPEYLWGSLQYHLAGTVFTARPRMIQFPVCDRCNARCIMCNRWSKESKNEIGIEKIRKVFRSPLFSKVEQANLHGGEPTLRRDLAEICSIIQENCPRLSRIWISTNGLGAKRIESRLLEVVGVLDFKRLQSLDVNVSIDGVGATHDRIRGVPGAFDQAAETLGMLRRLAQAHPINISIGTVIQPLNLRELDGIERFAAGAGVPVVFQPLMFDDFFNLEGTDDLRFSEEDKKLLETIVETKLSRGHSQANYYWCDYVGIRGGKRRKSPCAFDRYIFSIYPTGEVLPCSARDWIMFGNVHEEAVEKIWYGQKADAVRKRMKAEVCPTCPAYCAVEFSLQKEFLKYFAFYVRGIMSGDANRPHRGPSEGHS